MDDQRYYLDAKERDTDGQGRVVQGGWHLDDGEEEAAKEKADDDYVDEQDRDLDF